MLVNRKVCYKKPDMTSENIIPVILWMVAQFRLLMKIRTMVVEIGEERVKNKDIHRKKKQNLKIQWLGVGDSRKSQKQLCGRGL